MPRVLNMYSTAPFFRTYFEALGIPKKNVVFSEPTSEEMWVEGGKYGSIDPCFPSKVVQAHVHNLFFRQARAGRRPRSDAHLLPDPHARAELREGHDGQRLVSHRRRHARRDEGRVHQGGRLLRAARHPVRRSGALASRSRCCSPSACSRPSAALLGVTEDESDHACRQGFKALDAFEADLQDKGRAILETVEAEDRIALLVLNRPYHSDPG